MTSPALFVVGGLIVVAVVGVGIWLTARPAVAPTVTPLLDSGGNDDAADRAVPAQRPAFTATKTPHFVSSEPANNAVVTAAPARVVITFNFDVVPPSKIAVSRDGADVTSGSTVIATDKLSMSVPLAAPQTGNYQVNYTACWPDKSCHNGSFGFSVQLAP